MDVRQQNLVVLHHISSYHTQLGAHFLLYKPSFSMGLTLLAE